MSLIDAGFFAKGPERTFQPKPWMLKPHVKMSLVYTEEDLIRVIDECIESGIYSLDLETTGLDTRVFNKRTVASIVGACLSPDGCRGYYIPLRHMPGGKPSPYNASWTITHRELHRLIYSKAVALFHNAEFDQELLQYNGDAPLGVWGDPRSWHDTLILAYLRDSRSRRKGLKFLTKQELGLTMITLDELFEINGLRVEGEIEESDFSLLDPKGPGVVEYAAGDALCTFMLYHKIKDESLHLPSGAEFGPASQALVYNIEKMCLTASRWMQRSRIKVDRNKVQELIQRGQQEYMAALELIYVQAKRILKRDLRPLSYHILRETVIPEMNPDLKSYPSDDERNFRAMRKKAAKMAKKIKRDIDGDFLTAVLDYPQHYHDICAMENPPPREGVKLAATYDLTAAVQLGALLHEMGVRLEKTEKSQQIKTSKDSLDKAIEAQGKRFPFLKYIKVFREIDKALGTYLQHLLNDTCREMYCYGCGHSFGGDEFTPCPRCKSKDVERDNTIKVNFKQFHVDTGRYSVSKGKGPDIDGRARIPMQGIPATYDPNRPECMGRIRECIIPRMRNAVLAAVDYAGVELRLVTILSGESEWEREYFRCSSCDYQFVRGSEIPFFCPGCGSDKIGDIHTLTAIGIYGEDTVLQDATGLLRKNCKGVNFGLCYGGGPKAVVRAIGCHINEGYRIKERFDNIYKTLAEWWEKQRRFARKYGYVLTAFGRKYPLPDIHHKDGGFRSKAERNAVNGPIQGSSADVTKSAMAFLYQEAVIKGWVDLENPHNDIFRLIMTMHDELVFEISLDIIEEAFEMIERLMSRNPVILSKNWNIGLCVDMEFGMTWDAHWNYTQFKHGKKPWPDEIASHFKCAEGMLLESQVKKPDALPEAEEPSSEEAIKEPLPDGVLRLRVNTSPEYLRVVAKAIKEASSDKGVLLELYSRQDGVKLKLPEGLRVDKARFATLLSGA